MTVDKKPPHIHWWGQIKQDLGPRDTYVMMGEAVMLAAVCSAVALLAVAALISSLLNFPTLPALFPSPLLLSELSRRPELALIPLAAYVAAWFAGYYALKIGKKPRQAMTLDDESLRIWGRDTTVHERDKYIERCMKKSMERNKKFLKVHEKVFFHKRQCTTSTLVVAGSGAGKTQRIIHWVEQFKKEYRCLVLDQKRDYIKMYGEKSYTALICLDDARSLVWDLAKDLNNKYRSMAWASGLVSAVGDKGDNWENGAKIIIAACVDVLGKERGEQWDAVDLERVLSKSDVDLFNYLYDAGEWEAAKLINPSSPQTAASYMSNVALASGLIRDMARHWGNSKRERFSVVEWVHNPNIKRNMLLIKEGMLGSTANKAFFTAITTLITEEVMRLGDDEMMRTLCFFFDEFGQLGKWDAKKFITFCRSKGLCLYISVQDISQILKVYGKDDTATMLSSIGTKLVLKINPGETRKIISEWFGNQEWINRTKSYNSSSSGTSSGVKAEIVTRPTMRIEEFGALLGRFSQDMYGKKTIEFRGILWNDDFSEPLLLGWTLRKYKDIYSDHVPYVAMMTDKAFRILHGIHANVDRQLDAEYMKIIRLLDEHEKEKRLQEDSIKERMAAAIMEKIRIGKKC